MKISEISVSYNPKVKLKDCPQIQNSQDAHKNFCDNWNGDILLRESFYVMFLNKANKVKGISLISIGGIDGTIADMKIIFAIALKTLSSSIILAHNHPSGNLNPSNMDRSLTKKAKEAGEILGIKVLDHLIVTPEAFPQTDLDRSSHNPGHDQAVQ